MSSHEKVIYTAKPLGKHPPHYENLVHTPGRRLMHDVRLEFVKKKVHGGGHRGVAASLNLTSMIDYLVTVVIFLLMSFSASGETPMDKNVTLPSAQNASDMVTAPIVAVNGKQILVDGKPIGSTQNVEESGRVNPRIDELYTVLKTLKDDWKKLNPGKGEHPGVVLLQIDKGVKALVVKSVFQTAASAGYPNVGFMVGQIPKSSAAPAELSNHRGPSRPGASLEVHRPQTFCPRAIHPPCPTNARAVSLPSARPVTSAPHEKRRPPPVDSSGSGHSSGSPRSPCSTGKKPRARPMANALVCSPNNA
jgi:biopolymer transport protein ExbD